MKKHRYIFLFASVIAMQFFGSCNEESIDKVNDPIPYDPIGGYEKSDDIAANNLISKLSFEMALTDSKNNITNAVGTNSNYGEGAKSYAYLGSSSQNAYMVGDASTAITGLNSFTISFWLNSANTVPDGGSPGQGKGAQGIFSIVRPAEFWGGINVFLENPDASKPNRLLVKLTTESGRSGVVFKGQNIVMNVDDNLNKWIHVVFSYNPVSSTASCYLNGALVTSAVWYASDPGGPTNPNNAPKYGDFVMTGTNGKVVFGTHQFETNPPLNTGGADQPWATSLVGLVDEFRIYNSALTNSEVTALYKLEKDNR